MRALLKRVPRNFPKLAQRLELAVTELDPPGADDARVDGERLAHRLVRADACVVPQDEVVALRVADLVPRRRAREHEDAPVLDVADDAAVAEDLLARREDDSVYCALGQTNIVNEEEKSVEGDALLDLGEIAGTSLARGN